MRQWFHDEVSQAFESNAALFSAAADVMGGESLQLEQMLVAATYSPIAFFNQAVTTAPLADAEAAVHKAVSFFDERGLPFTISVIGEDHDGARAAESAGLKLAREEPLMLLHRDELHISRPAPEDFEIRPANPVALDEHIGQELPHAAREAYRNLLTTLLGVDGFRLWCGYLDGRGVSNAASWTWEGLVGVFAVGTATAFRRRGIAEALTAAAIRKGFEDGAMIAYLFSSEMALSMYKRMGFRPVSSHRYYVRPPSA